MYEIQERYSAYRRGVIYFTIYSVILFIVTSVSFLQIKTMFYFLVGFALSGAVAVFFMSLQYKIEKGLNPNFWILNIFIEIIGYYIFTQLLFILMF